MPKESLNPFFNIPLQTMEIGRVVTGEKAEQDGIDLALLDFVSPIEWENILLYGEYVIDKSLIQVALRPFSQQYA